MAEQEAKRAAGAHEVKSAMAGFMSDLIALQNDIRTQLKDQEHRLTMLDRKTAAAERPALEMTSREVPHKKAFAAYVRSGDEDAMRGLEMEGKALASTGDGGFLVDPVTAETIGGVLRGASSLRSVANVVTVEATAYDVLVDHGDVGSGWSNEATDQGETTTPTLERISIPLHELSALPKASQRLLDDSAFDVEGWLAARIGDKFARAESAAFIAGTGTDQPTGFLDYDAVANAAWTWGEIGYVATGANGDFSSDDPADAIVDLVYSLGARYRANATFVMNSKTAGAVRKMKDADGRFLWADSFAAAEPARLMGYPVLICEDMPDIESDATAIAFGDFRAGYTIAERPDLRILRDPFSAKPHVLFYATKRVGGDVSDFAAIKLLKFSVN